MQDHFPVSFHDKKFPLHRRDHLAQGKAHGCQVEMEGERAFQPAFRRDHRFEEGDCGIVGEEVFIRAGIAAKGAGFSLCHKPRTGAGIKDLARFINNNGRGPQIVALDIGQGDGRDTGHQILQVHQQLQTLCRIVGDHFIKLLIT
ncbi:hypothetical protein DR73_4594 [Enterobacteriaceae bacterium ATCC 29904]|nr:hypothetical protein DR73_4594 [Enterobacteriaceae bacterium ATCC 29904]